MTTKSLNDELIQAGREQVWETISSLVFGQCDQCDLPRPMIELLPAGEDPRVVTLKVTAGKRSTTFSYLYPQVDTGKAKDASWAILNWYRPSIFLK